MNLTKLFNQIAFRSASRTPRAKAWIKRVDRGILEVSLMVAAIDGAVLPSEFKAFLLLARKGFGYSQEAAEEALRRSMHSAGYVLMLANREKTQEGFVKAFIEEARAALPRGFAYMKTEDVRQAIVCWIAMAMSDGDYSARERACIEALRMRFAELKARRIEKENEYWRAVPANVRCIVEDYPGSHLKLVSKDFVGKLATLIREFGGSAEAKRKLESLIATGE